MCCFFLENFRSLLICAHPAVIWEVIVSDLPRPQRQAIYGLTDYSRHPSAVARFLRFRFPFVRFEWHVKTSYSALATLTPGGGTTDVSFSWTALASGSSSFGMCYYVNIVWYGKTLLFFRASCTRHMRRHVGLGPQRLSHD